MYMHNNFEDYIRVPVKNSLPRISKILAYLETPFKATLARIRRFIYIATPSFKLKPNSD